MKSQQTSLKLVTCSKGICSSSSMAWRIVLSTLCSRKSNAAGFCQHTRPNSHAKIIQKVVKQRASCELKLYHFETAGDVTAEHPWLQRLHVAAHVGLRVHDVAVVCQFVEDLLLLVGEDDVCVEGLHHEQSFTQSPRTFTQHLVTEGRMQEKKGIIFVINVFLFWISVSFYKPTQWTNLIRLHGDDGAQGEYEGVNIFHVQVIRGHSIWHRVGGQSLTEK